MRRIGRVLLGAFAVAALAAISSGPASAGYGARNCAQDAWICTEVYRSIGPNGAYTGHDEPSLLFYSSRAGSGTGYQTTFVLPKDPKLQPIQSGRGATWNFQLHPAFWFGMAMCDNESAPEFTKTCNPGTDANIKDDSNPASPNYIGRHAGAAFLEMQFYPPGWVPWEQGVSCTAKQWCAALNIDSFDVNMNAANGGENNAACVSSAGDEPVAFAFITKDGHPQATVDPRTAFAPPFTQTTPDTSRDLLMNSGDVIHLDMHDTPAGLQVLIDDLTTGQHGSMLASAANGWNHVLYQPSSSTCNIAPYSFHPMYSTSGEHTRVPWAAHTYNIAFSDEIGHFEYCRQADENGNCVVTNDGSPPDIDDFGCFNPDDSLLVMIGGCLGTDVPDFDGVPYQKVWPGATFNPVADLLLRPQPIAFQSLTFNGSQNYDRVAFETDLPAIESPNALGTCNTSTGTGGCTNPPPGANFYPLYTTGIAGALGVGRFPGAGCVWRLGGAFMPGTLNTFGGTSTAEFGQILQSVYPDAGFKPLFLFENFRQILSTNPCPSR